VQEAVEDGGDGGVFEVEPLWSKPAASGVLTDSADGLDIIAQHTVDALIAAHRRRPAAQQTVPERARREETSAGKAKPTLGAFARKH
jgi:hypothetical protein